MTLQDMTLQDESAGDDNAGHDNVRQTTLRIFGGVTVVSVSFLRNTRHFTFCHVFLLHGTNQITIRIQISTTFLYSCKVSTCHFSARRYASVVYAMALCLSFSVCLSVTSRCSTKVAQHRITQTTPRESTWILLF